MNIFVNGNPAFLCPARGRRRPAPMMITYELLCSLAGLDGRMATISYATRDGSHGHVGPRQSVAVVDGMRFNVVVTDNA